MLVETRNKHLSSHKRYILQLNKAKTIQDQEKIKKINERLKKIYALLERNNIDFRNLDYAKINQDYSGENLQNIENLLDKILDKYNVEKLDFLTRRKSHLVELKMAIAIYLRRKNYTLQLIATLFKCHHSSILNLTSKDLKYYPEVAKIISEIDKINQEASNE